MRRISSNPSRGGANCFVRPAIAGVQQEIWGGLIAYNLVRQEIAKAAIQARVEPTELSFLRALHILQNEMIWAAGMAPGKLPAHLLRLRPQRSGQHSRAKQTAKEFTERMLHYPVCFSGWYALLLLPVWACSSAERSSPSTTSTT